jgi:hypothetical protein
MFLLPTGRLRWSTSSTSRARRSAYASLRRYVLTMKPAMSPHQWYLTIGGILLVISVVMMINGVWLSAADVGIVAGIVLVGFGLFGQNRR